MPRRKEIQVDHKTYLSMKRKVKAMKLVGTYSYPDGWQSTYEDGDGNHWTHGANDYGHVWVESPNNTVYWYI